MKERPSFPWRPESESTSEFCCRTVVGEIRTFPLCGTHINRNSRYSWPLSTCQGQAHATLRAGPERDQQLLQAWGQLTSSPFNTKACMFSFCYCLCYFLPSWKMKGTNKGFSFFLRKLGKDQALWKRKIWSQRFRKVKKKKYELKKEEYRSRTENKSRHFSNLVKKICFAVKHMPSPKMTTNHVCLGVLWLAFLGTEQKGSGQPHGYHLGKLEANQKASVEIIGAAAFLGKEGLYIFPLNVKWKTNIKNEKKIFLNIVALGSE